MRSLRFRPAAEHDFAEIQEYIAEDNPAAADRFIKTLENQCRNLVFTPFLGRACPEIRPDFRCLVFGRYKIYYTVTDELVAIVRILHSRRDIKKQF